MRDLKSIKSGDYIAPLKQSLPLVDSAVVSRDLLSQGVAEQERIFGFQMAQAARTGPRI
jgi:hypothetical protein